MMSDLSSKCMAFATNVFPVVTWLPSYSLGTLKKDLLSGLTVGVMAVPQSMSYATVAGLPPVFGLYNTMIGLASYPIFGTSPQLIVGPTAVMSIIVAGSVPTTWHGESVEDNVELYCKLSFLLSFTAGLLQLIFGACRLGFIVELVSEPVVLGFIMGSACIIGSSQLAALLGISSCDPKEFGGSECHFHETVYSAFENLHGANVPTVVSSLCAVLLLLVIKFGLRRIHPMLGTLGPLTLVLVALPFIYTLEQHHGVDTVVKGNTTKYYTSKYRIQTVGPIPSGLPSFSSPFAPVHGASDITEMFSEAFVVALVGYMEAVTIAKAVARKVRYKGKVDPNAELIALGSCNLACSGLQGFPVTGSFSRTAVNADSGAKTQLAGGVAATVVIVVLLSLTSTMQYMPKFALAAIVFVSILNLLSFDEVLFLFRVCPHDFAIFLVVFLVTLFFGVEPGLLVGILGNWAGSLMHRQRAQASLVVLCDGSSQTKEWRCISDLVSDQAKSQQLAGGIIDDDEALRAVSLACSDKRRALIVRPATDLYFATTHAVFQAVDEAQSAFSADAVILDCAQVRTVDASGLQVLSELSTELSERGCRFLLVALLPSAVRKLHTAKQRRAALRQNPTRWDVPSPTSAASSYPFALRARFDDEATEDGDVDEDSAQALLDPMEAEIAARLSTPPALSVHDSIATALSVCAVELAAKQPLDNSQDGGEAEDEEGVEERLISSSFVDALRSSNLLGEKGDTRLRSRSRLVPSIIEYKRRPFALVPVRGPAVSYKLEARAKSAV